MQEKQTMLNPWPLQARITLSEWAYYTTPLPERSACAARAFATSICMLPLCHLGRAVGLGTLSQMSAKLPRQLIQKETATG
jgi:hypothetical protein